LRTERVTQHLLSRGIVTPAQVDEARRTQAFFGGELESLLLKLGFVDEETLGDSLTEIHGVPYASGSKLRVIAPDVLKRIPPAFAQQFRVCPFRFEDDRLRVAMLDPHDARALTALRAHVGAPVEPWITSEYRLYEAIERHYQVPVAGVRSIALAPPAVRRLMRLPQEVEAPTAPAAAPQKPEVELGLDGRALDADVVYEEPVCQPQQQPDAGSEPGATAAPVPPGEDEATSVSRLDAALSAAADRDELADAILSFCATRAARCALFAVGKEGIRGLAGRGRGFETDSLRKVTVSPEASVVFDAALKSGDFYFGVVPPLPATRDLYTVLGGRLPATALIVPILVKERAVVLLYLDDDERAMTRPDIPLMRRVAAKAGLAFEILLLRNKLRAL
jgi:hypothetical protein